MRPLDTSKLPEPPVELTPVRGSWVGPLTGLLQSRVASSAVSPALHFPFSVTDMQQSQARI